MSVVSASAASAQIEKDDLQLLVCKVHGEEFAFPLTDILEIIPSAALTDIPNAPAAIRGMLNLRGKVVTVVDLSTVLGFGPTADILHSHIVVAAGKGRELFGILVDGVTGVLRTASSKLQPTPELLQARASSAFVKGALVLSDETKDATIQAVTINKADGSTTQTTETTSRMILLLDEAKILSSIGASAA